jgi:hypothetical protein
MGTDGFCRDLMHLTDLTQLTHLTALFLINPRGLRTYAMLPTIERTSQARTAGTTSGDRRIRL